MCSVTVVAPGKIDPNKCTSHLAEETSLFDGGATKTHKIWGLERPGGPSDPGASLWFIALVQAGLVK